MKTYSMSSGSHKDLFIETVLKKTLELTDLH